MKYLQSVKKCLCAPSNKVTVPDDRHNPHNQERSLTLYFVKKRRNIYNQFENVSASMKHRHYGLGVFCRIHRIYILDILLLYIYL